jgi:hypothetical protein
MKVIKKKLKYNKEMHSISDTISKQAE